MLTSLGADLIAAIPPGGGYADAARGWLDGVLAEVFPDLLDGLWARPASRSHDDGLPVDEPGQVLGEIRLGAVSPVPRRAAVFSATSWQKLLGSLASTSPQTVSLSIRVVGGDGFLCREEAHIEVKRSPSDPEWVRFVFTAPSFFTGRGRLAGPGGGRPDSPEMQERWAAFVQRQAAQVGACEGFVTDDTIPGGETALERAVSAFVQHHNYRKTLNGYSWVTIVPAGPTARLGGAQALSASGAFFEVSELPDGAVWLRATPTINEFTGERVRAVFEPLAPVMLRGRPRPPRFGEERYPAALSRTSTPPTTRPAPRRALVIMPALVPVLSRSPESLARAARRVELLTALRCVRPSQAGSTGCRAGCRPVGS
jgi:hypothetical protein